MVYINFMQVTTSPLTLLIVMLLVTTRLLQERMMLLKIKVSGCQWQKLRVWW